MAAIITRRRWRSPPTGPVEVDWSSNLLVAPKTTEIMYLGTPMPIGAATGTRYAESGCVVLDGPGGIGRFFHSLANDYITLAADADTVLDTSVCTMLVVRSLTTIASLSSSQTHGYSVGANDRSAVHLPYDGDKNIYWDFGNATGGSGRVSASASGTWVSGKVEAFAFVAGPTKGREIWRNGVRVASDASATATRSATAAAFKAGAADGGGGGSAQPEITYFFLLAKEEWEGARIVEWSANPWQIFRPRTRRLYSVAAAAPAFQAGWAVNANSTNQQLPA